MPIEKLTAQQVTRILRPGRYSDGGGLYLQVSKTLVKSWVFRFKINDMEHYMGLGPLRLVGLRKARGKAREARTMLTKGTNPLQARRKQNAQGQLTRGTNPLQARQKQNVQGQIPLCGNKTFDECVTEYIENHKVGWKNPRHASQWKNSLTRYASPCFGEVDVREIDTALVLQALKPIWTTKTETASRLRERIERVLSFAAILGYRAGANPARWQKHLQELLPSPSQLKEVRHHPAVPYQEIAGFFSQFDMEKRRGAPVLAFTILTVARTSEVLMARWAEIDFEARIWTIPSERMKSARQHRVPLAEAALDILRRQAGLHPVWIFPGRKKDSAFNASILRDTLRHMNRADVTAHGFRSSFRVWAAERTTYPKEIAELALAHRVGSKVEAAYQRSDLFEQRRNLLRDWARWCTGCVDPHP